MVDKVRPLKIEEAGAGTDIDMMPKETDPTEDYISSKGLAIEESDSLLVDADAGEIQFTDTINGTKKVSDLLDAEQEDFDPTGTDLVSTKTGPAIRELFNSGGNSASAGVIFGRSSNTSATTWLQNEGVPSNKTGVPLDINNPELVKISTGSENLDTYTITIYEHEGDSINLTSLDTISVVSSRNGSSSTSVAITPGRQLAIALTSGSARNIKVTLSIKGNS